MSEFNKTELLEKTTEYMNYIAQHKENIRKAWLELRDALKGIDLFQRPKILDEMEWRIRNHDDSKMSEEEFLPYRQHFYPVAGEVVDDAAFELAWERHYRTNDHHWQYWIDCNGDFMSYYDVDTKICAYLEMICDWQATGYVNGDSAPEYYRNHKDEIKIDPNWVSLVEEILDLLDSYIAARG